MNVDASLNPVTITLAGDDDARDTCSGLLMALRELALAVTAPGGAGARVSTVRTTTAGALSLPAASVTVTR